MERVIAYIDGFNLYYGMMDAGFGRYRWLKRSGTGTIPAKTRTKAFTSELFHHIDYKRRGRKASAKSVTGCVTYTGVGEGVLRQISEAAIQLYALWK